MADAFDTIWKSISANQSDRQHHNPFDVAWGLMKMSDETRDALDNFDRIVGSPLNIASLFSGLGDSDLSQHSPLGLAGF